MRDWLSFVYRNPAYVTRNARKQNSVRRAMARHRRENPTCKLTHSKKIRVHHIIPVSVAPELADDPDNLVSLHPYAHFLLGHALSWTRHVPGILELIDWMHKNVDVVQSVKPEVTK